MLAKVWNKDRLIDIEFFKETLRNHIGDLTFLELYEQNKWNLNIAVTDSVRWDEQRVLNYVTAPNVVVWSAVLASNSLPVLHKEYGLMIKTETGEIKQWDM